MDIYLGKKHHFQTIFEKSLHLGIPQAPYILFSCTSGQNSHISHTAYTRNFILIPKDTEYAVSYPTTTHAIALASLDFKLAK